MLASTLASLIIAVERDWIDERAFWLTGVGLALAGAALWLCWLALIGAGRADPAVLAYRRERTRFVPRLRRSSPQALDELLLRRGWWSEHFQSRPKNSANRYIVWVDAGRIVASSGFLFVLLLGVVVVVGARMALHAALYLMCCVCAVASATLGGRHARKLSQRLANAAWGTDCPNCEYDLLSLRQDPTNPDSISGPRRCPECGCPWPLIPPPIPLAPAHRRMKQS